MPIAQPVPTQLFPGLRLTRAEFLRRWDGLPELKNAELIDEIVYMASPVSNEHSEFEALILWWLGAYAVATTGCKAGSNGTWLMLESAPQPDAHLRLLPEFGGQSRTEGKYCHGAPELAVEVSDSTVATDLGPKMALYQRAGVREYLTVSLKPARVTWRELVGGSYKQIRASADGLLRSKAFPGLWLDGAALLAQNPARLLEALQSGIASPEHAAFVRSFKK